MAVGVAACAKAVVTENDGSEPICGLSNPNEASRCRIRCLRNSGECLNDQQGIVLVSNDVFLAMVVQGTFQETFWKVITFPNFSGVRHVFRVVVLYV